MEIKGRLFLKQYFTRYDGPYNSLWFEANDGKEYPVVNNSVDEALYHKKGLEGTIFHNNGMAYVIIKE